MTTPYIYGKDHFAKILDNYPDFAIFHQTRLANLKSIISNSAVYSTGTLWGMEDHIRKSPAFNSNQVSAWKTTAENGFIDYVFSSSLNYLASGKNTFGTVTFEFDKKILLDRESFVFPRATRFGFPQFKAFEKSSDTTMWIVILNSQKKYNAHEILLRRKMDLNQLVRIHCYRSVKATVTKDLQGSAFAGIPIDTYDNPVVLGIADMKATINNMTLDAYFVKGSVSRVDIYNKIDEEYAEYCGEYEVDAYDNILENVVLTSEKIVIGRLHRDAQNVAPHGISSRG